MTAAEMIEEIKRLPRDERSRVIEFARQAGERRQLSPEELGRLAKEMVDTNDPAEADRLQKEIVHGFYGGSLMPKIRRHKLPQTLLVHLLTLIKTFLLP